ncbi:lamin tail domain-containing protein [Actinoplanes rectilineatus]|uniref:lamin tail domain-containing protein n=1 Tax=Actinoplanes rectilineatus TaxID=113571 RepID=UPI0005F2CB25|nr:lamin tail domain-containing protein [Actinoplanes rectilineatus]
MLRRLAALTLTATLALLGAAVPAQAAMVACRHVASGPRCLVWTGTVSWVADGDTPRVDLDGDGTRELVSIRLVGIQAMEQSVYSPQPAKRRGDCHALQATARFEQLVKAGGGKIRITALQASSSSGRRPLRSVAVRIDDQWHDVGLDLVRRGLALWLPFSGEWAWDEQYRKATQQAAADRVGLFDTDFCGSGPSQDSGIRMTVNGDPDGVDADNLNGEYFRIVNPSSRAVPVGGWWVRDSALRRYTIPPGNVVPAGGEFVVHVGRGTNTATHKYWGLSQPIFTNVDPANHGYGDGGYLFDPQGDLRAWDVYPCVVACQGKS